MKKTKKLTIRQQIQQCPTLTPEERSLALYGLNKAKMIKSASYDKTEKYRLGVKFLFGEVPVIKGQYFNEAFTFWWEIRDKLIKYTNT